MKTIVITAMLFCCTLSVFGQDKLSDGAPASSEAKAGKQCRPMKVYILSGQSNMTGMVSSSTLEHIKMFPDTAKEFADLFDENGNPLILDEVYVSQWKEKDGGKLAPKYGGGKGERLNN